MSGAAGCTCREAVKAVGLVLRPHHGRQRRRERARGPGEVRRIRRQAVLRGKCTLHIMDSSFEADNRQGLTDSFKISLHSRSANILVQK